MHVFSLQLCCIVLPNMVPHAGLHQQLPSRVMHRFMALQSRDRPLCNWAHRVTCCHCPRQVAAVVVVLRVARSVGIAGDLAAVAAPDGGAVVRIPESIVRAAVGHRSDSLRADALHLACTHPRTSSLPSTRGFQQVCSAVPCRLTRPESFVVPLSL